MFINHLRIKMKRQREFLTEIKAAIELKVGLELKDEPLLSETNNALNEILLSKIGSISEAKIKELIKHIEVWRQSKKFNIDLATKTQIGSFVSQN